MLAAQNLRQGDISVLEPVPAIVEMVPSRATFRTRLLPESAM
jgi:hypothetical protein